MNQVRTKVRTSHKRQIKKPACRRSLPKKTDTPDKLALGWNLSPLFVSPPGEHQHNCTGHAKNSALIQTTQNKHLKFIPDIWHLSHLHENPAILAKQPAEFAKRAGFPIDFKKRSAPISPFAALITLHSLGEIRRIRLESLPAPSNRQAPRQILRPFL